MNAVLGRESATGRVSIAAARPVMYLQPIVDIATGVPVAVEALARFPAAPHLSVGSVFAWAREVGGGVDLEALCVRSALDLIERLPAGVDLAVNVSPDAVEHPLLQETLSRDLTGVIVEVTEQPASDPARLAPALAELRRRGARVAVDDVTTGHAGLMRLAELRPDIIKIDRGAVQAIRGGAEQVAVVEALVSMGRRLECQVLAEGVERLDDLATLAALDVDLAQGWAIATPAAEFEPISADVQEACRAARRRVLEVVPTPIAPRDIDIHHVTAELARTAHRFQLDRALLSASYTLGMSMIAVSVLDEKQVLHEVISTGADIDPAGYALADFPATAAALRDGVMLEVWVDCDEGDPRERELLRRLGQASLLLVPLIVDARPCGVLELFRDTHRRWTGRDIADARVLAQHLAHALDRVTVGS